MSTIDRNRWRILEPLLDTALDLSPDDRNALLEKLHANDPLLAADLRTLLANDAIAERDGFLIQPLEITLEGHEIGDYSLVRPLGHGGMGSVWLARRTDTVDDTNLEMTPGTPVAVKLLNLSLLSGAGQERFRREGAMLARLAHPYIARLLDAGVSNFGQPFLILEYVDGRPLDEFAEANVLSTDDRLALFLRVLDAVGHAHANSVVHRDLKPSNILVTHDGVPKLLDFGIAKMVEGDGAGTPSLLTLETGAACTPRFASPEQLDGNPITAATDVYALGVILYVMLTGEDAELIRSLSNSSLDTVIANALQDDPAKRYQSVKEFADDVRRVMRHEPVSAQRDSSNWWRRSKRAFRHDR